MIPATPIDLQPVRAANLTLLRHREQNLQIGCPH